MTPSESTDDEPRSKVGRVIQKYELVGLGTELERRWTSEGDERSSLRTLADHVNREILRSTFEDQGRQSADEFVENAYHVLTDDDVTASARTQLTRDLERDGIGVETVLDDFVSHQAVHTYLRKYRDVSAPSTETDPVRSTERAIERLQSRASTVVSSNVDRLENAGEIRVGDPEVLVSVDVLCSECGTAKPVGRLLEDGSCDCPE